MNPVSKLALCATSMASPTYSRNSGNTSSIVGASRTILSLIDVSLVILYGIGTSGFTKREYLS